MSFTGKSGIEAACLIKKAKNAISLVLVSKSKILAYELNRANKSLTHGKTIYNF